MAERKRTEEHTDLLQAAKQVLPLLQLQNADNNLVSCTFSDLLLEERFLCHIMLIQVRQHEDFSDRATGGRKERKVVFGCMREKVYI